MSESSVWVLLAALAVSIASVNFALRTAWAAFREGTEVIKLLIKALEFINADDDKIDGLESELDSALDIIWRRGDAGSRDWVRMNYPNKYGGPKEAA